MKYSSKDCEELLAKIIKLRGTPSVGVGSLKLYANNLVEEINEFGGVTIVLSAYGSSTTQLYALLNAYHQGYVDCRKLFTKWDGLPPACTDTLWVEAGRSL